jgi:hypothetical protein
MKRSMFRILLMLSVVVSGLAGVSSAAAQDLDFEPDYFQSEISDIEIELSRSDFEITGANAQSYPGGEGETVRLSSDGAFVQVAFYDDPDTNLETMELYNSQFEGEVDEFVVLDTEEDGEVVWTFAAASLEGQELLYFLSVTEDVDGNVDLLEGIYATEPVFFDDLLEAQETISIGGDPFLAEIDVDELEDIYSTGGSDNRSGDDDDRSREDDADDDTRSRDRDDQDEDDSRTRDREDAEDDTRSRDTDEDEDNTRSRDRDTEDESRSRDRDDDEEDPDNGSTRGRTSGGEQYQFEVVSADLTVSGGVEVVDAVVNAPGVEQIQLKITDTDGIALVQMVRARTSAEATLDQILANLAGASGSFENVGTGADATSAWSLDATVSGGEEALILVYVETDRFPDYHYVEVIISPHSDFLDDLDTLNSDVEIDGEGLFAGVDFFEMEELVGGGSSDRQTDDTGDESGRDREGTSGRRTDAKIEAGEDPGTTRDRSRDRDDTSDASGIDLESQGLVSAREFESLQYGYVVEWDDAVWSVDVEWELSANSDTENGVDHVILFWLDGNASMLIQIMPADGAGPADFVDVWESGDYIVDAVHEDAEILESDSGRSSGAVVYLTYNDDGDELILIQEVIDIDGGDTVALITMFGAPEDVADAYADAEDLVTVDGLDLVGTFTPREITSAVGP